MTVDRFKFWWGMVCWNGLSLDQQMKLLRDGVLPWGYEPEGECTNGATVAIECQDDVAPGPRFLCLSCAIVYLIDKQVAEMQQ